MPKRKMCIAILHLFIIVISIAMETTGQKHTSNGWFVVLKRSSNDDVLINSFARTNNDFNKEYTSKIHRINLNNHEKVDFMSNKENKQIYESSLLSGLFLTKSTITSRKTFRVLEFASDLTLTDALVHKKVDNFINHLNLHTTEDTNHDILFKEKNYIIKSHEFRNQHFQKEIADPYALHRTIRYFPTTIGHNNTNGTRVRSLNANVYCRFAVGSGRLGYQPGAFSWGVDVLDQRGGNIDGTYCPYGGVEQGRGTHVYILDSGMGIHDSMNTVTISRDFDYYYNSLLYQNKPLAYDGNGHGSHVAGLIASRIYGVAPGASLHIYKVLDDQGSGSFASLAAGLSDIYDKSVRSGIISMSLGTTQGISTAITFFINNLYSARDFTIVASAGNDGGNSCNNYPSNIPAVISIGAITSTYSKAFFSNYGACVTMYSPGLKIISTGMTSSSSLELSGTSMAAPLVAGTLAIYKQVNPSLTNNGLKSLLLARGTKNLIKSLDSVSPNNIVYNGFDIADGPPPIPDSPIPQPPSPPNYNPPPPSSSGGNCKRINTLAQRFILFLIVYTITLLLVLPF